MKRVGWGTICLLSLEFLALGLWVGGLIVLVGAVIPAVFNTFGGQEAGGFLLTRAFEGYNRLVVFSLIVLASAMGYRHWHGETAMVGRGEWILLSAMGGIAGLIILVLHPQAAALQAEAFSLKDDQAKKAAFEAFFRLHKPIRSLYVVNVLLGIWLLVLKVKRSLQQEGVPV